MLFRLRTQLILLSLGLMVLPWLGYRYIADIQEFLLKGQEQAQLLTTQAIATAIQDRPQLLTRLPTSDPAGNQRLLYAQPTDQHLLADGYAEEWEQTIPPARFWLTADRNNPLAMALRFLQREDRLYLLIEVEDQQLVYRHPGYRRLDTSDQIRLTVDGQGYIITSEGVGTITAFASDARWRYPLPAAINPQIQGGWRETPNGYRVELQLPLSLLGNSSQFVVAVADVDDPVERRITQLLSSADQGASRLLAHSPELQRLIRGLKRNNRRLWIFDVDRRIRAVSNTPDNQPELPQRHQEVIDRAMQGLPALKHYRDGNKAYILAAQPIDGADKQRLGVAVVEVATDDILNLQRLTLLKSGSATAMALLLLLSGLLYFAYRLTRRIARLQTEARNSVDAQGRVLVSTLEAEQHARDEIGDLARDMSQLIGKLHHYTQFLEHMPKTLRHELSNPLNTISTSLEILKEDADARQQPYLESAERGVARLSMILTSLTEATSLEQSLGGEPLQPLDLAHLLEQYVVQLQSSNQDRYRINFSRPAGACWILGIDLRLEQLLDKLADNALDFAPLNSDIDIGLSQCAGGWRLRVANQGEPIAAEIADNLFDSLVSGRPGCGGPGRESPHLGMGLYVVNTIVHHHGGKARAFNAGDKVVFEIELPAIEPPPRPIARGETGS